MVQITHEGQVINPGINIGWSISKHPWIRFIYCGMKFCKDVPYGDGLGYRSQEPIITQLHVRIRTCWPFILVKKVQYDFIENYLANKDLVLVTKDVYSDLINYIPKVCREQVVLENYLPYKGKL